MSYVQAWSAKFSLGSTFSPVVMDHSNKEEQVKSQLKSQTTTDS